MKHRPRGRPAVALAVSILGVGAAADVGAQARLQARLTVEAEADCASVAAIAARVRARSSQIHFGAGGDGPQLTAAVKREPGGRVSAALTLRSGLRRSERQLEAGSCAEAVDALALLIALALDPNAAERAEAIEVGPDGETAPEAAAAPQPTPRGQRGGRERASASARSQTEAAAAPVEQTAPAPDPQPKAAGAAATLEAQPAAAVAPEEVRTSDGAFELSFTANVDARGLVGPAPALLTGFGVSVLLGWERDSLWSPALGLAAAHSWLNDVREAAGIAAFQLQVVRLDACFVRVQWGPAAVRGCGSGSLGRLYARGSATYEPESHARSFAMLGGTVLADVELGAHFGMHLAIGVAGPLARDAYAFEPSVFHRVSAVVLDGSIGAGVRFP